MAGDVGKVLGATKPSCVAIAKDVGVVNHLLVVLRHEGGVGILRVLVNNHDKRRDLRFGQLTKVSSIVFIKGNLHVRPRLIRSLSCNGQSVCVGANGIQHSLALHHCGISYGARELFVLMESMKVVSTTVQRKAYRVISLLFSSHVPQIQSFPSVHAGAKDTL